MTRARGNRHPSRLLGRGRDSAMQYLAIAVVVVIGLFGSACTPNADHLPRPSSQSPKASTAFTLENVALIRQLAERGNAGAQAALGEMYDRGEGVRQDLIEAVKWHRRAAEQGSLDGQINLGSKYGMGEGVPQDFVLAYMWTILGASKTQPPQPCDSTDRIELMVCEGLTPILAESREVAIYNRDALARVMTPTQIAEAQRLAREWHPKMEQPSSASSPSKKELQEREPQPDEPKALPRTEKELSYGSAFVVSRQGFLLTNEHVIEGCRNVELKLAQRVVTGRIVARDKSNDFALLKAPLPISSVATFRGGRNVRPGDSVVVIGFPLKGLLAEGPSVTTGVVSALAGPGNDTRLIQITAPVQPGNSGGPLLDDAGNVVGIVVSKLDALKVAAITGDIPQNVNFAIDARLAQKFLDANGVGYETAQSKLRLTPADVAERGMKFTVPVECYRPG